MSDACRDARIEEVIAAYVEAVEGGADPDPDPWLDRFPQMAGELARGIRDYLLTLDGGGPRSSASSGQILDGRYLLRRMIGRGPMSRVYEAEELQSGLQLAVKVVSVSRLDPVHRSRILRGIEAIGELDHPNVLPVLDCGEDGEVIYLTMPLIDGPDLASRIRRRRREEGPASGESGRGAPPAGDDPDRWRPDAILIRQVSEALDHVHHRGILHRDVKPGNILIDASGRPLLIDFDLAKGGEHLDLTRAESWVGTPRYMAPERFLGWCDVRSEVYALGLVLYELITLRPAFEAGSEEQLVSSVRRGRPRPPRSIDPKIPRPLERITLKALDREPSRRYQTAAALADDLGRFLDGEPVQARPPSPAGQLASWAREYPLAAGLLVLLALVMLAGAVSSTLLWRRSERMREHADRMWIFAEGDRAQARQLRAEALAALEAEQQALQLARRRFQLAMEAVQTLHSDVAGDLRLQQPEFSAVRTRLLEAALAFYERLLQAEGRQDEADPADLRLAADALREVATLCNNLADHERSVEANDRCRAILQRLVDSGRAPPGTYLRLVEALNALAIDRHNQGRRDEAHAFWQQADALLDLARGDPEGDRQVAKVVASMILGRGVAAAKEGRAEDARQLWWRCVELCRQVPAADRHADGLALPASMALMNLAMLPHPDEQGDRKERLILRAIAELRPQVEAQPGQPSFRATLRNYLLHLAQVRSGQRRWTDALGLYREAMVLSEQLVAEMPNLVVHQREALRSFAGLTAACLELLRVDEADQVLRAARSHCDRFVALEPRLVDFRINQVEFELATAELLELRGRFDEALVRYDRAQDRLDSPPLIETDHPAVPHLRSRALGRRVMALVRADRPDEAVGLVEAAAPDSLDPSNRAFLLLGKAGALATMGRPDEAMRSLREFDQAHLPSPLHYERAACWAQMAAVSRDEGDGDRAIDALRRARSLDFFGSPGHTRRLEIDPSFDALRDRADFRSLLLDVAFPGDPFAPAPLDLASEVPSPIVASSPAIVDRRPRPE